MWFRNEESGNIIQSNNDKKILIDKLVHLNGHGKNDLEAKVKTFSGSNSLCKF